MDGDSSDTETLETCIIKPIVYGNVSSYYNGQRYAGDTHKWTMYVRSCNHETLTSYVERVHFRLHDSYPNPERVVTREPFEISETGWLEFEIFVVIFFRDRNVPPLVLGHMLRLYQSLSGPNECMRNVISETHGEIIFRVKETRKRSEPRTTV